MESILTSIKKLLMLPEDYKQFDTDIIMHINSVFMTLTQLGVGPAEGFTIDDDTAIWSDFVDDVTKVQAIKTYIYLKVKILFDPGSIGSSTLAAYERQIQELEWRLNVIAESNAAADTDDNSGGNSNDNNNTGTYPSAGGTDDYTKLRNLPKINGTTLVGNYNEKDPTVKEMTQTDVTKLWNDLFDE